MQMTTAFQKLSESTRKYSTRLLTSPLSKRDAWIAYFAVFVPAISYTFAVTHHSPKTLHKLQSVPTRATLLKLGFNRNPPLAVVYGPSLHSDIALRNLPIKQGIAHLQMLIRHVLAETEQGILILILLAWWQLTVGMSFALLKFLSADISYLNPHWLSSIRVFLVTVCGSLYIPACLSAIPDPLRTFDRCLMDVVNSLTAVSRADYKCFNRVCIFYGALYLSEIASANGTQIARDAWSGSRPHFAPLLWPYQPRPGPRSFRVWRRLLATALIRGERKRASARTLDVTLTAPLGSWLPGSEWYQRKWTTFFSVSSNSLQCRIDNMYQCHSAHRLRQCPRNPVRGFSVTPSTTMLSLPVDAVPVDVSPKPQKLVIPVIVSTHAGSDAPTAVPTTWPLYLKSIPHWERVLLNHVSIPDLPALLAALTTDADLLLASDGGATDTLGSYGCLLASGDTILVD
jgi:hypothetical protein